MQGNYSGYQLWDISNPAKPVVKEGYVCPGSQSDVSVYRDAKVSLAFVSGEATTGRLDCGLQGVPDSVSQDRLRGIRVFDVSDLSKPKYIANVQTCRGSHTHTVVTSPNDKDNVYIYVSGSAPVRSPRELPGCSGATPTEDPNSALFRIEVIQVPLADPSKAHIVSSPRIFQDLTAPPRHAEPFDSAAAARRDSIAAARRAAGQPDTPRPGGGNNRGGPTQCHDITVYPGIGLAGGACGGYGLLLDISNPAQPVRIGAAADSNFSFWHSATFNNDGTKVLFSDEWGGGTQPRCRVTDKPEWGADAIFTLDQNKQMTFKSYYKLSAAQTQEENCVAHNGSLIPIPGRDVMVQALVSGRHLGVRLDGCLEREGDRVLRPRSDGRDEASGWRLVVGVLVQRLHLQLRDLARPRHLRARAEWPDLEERARRGEDGALRLLQHAGSAEARVAALVRAGARVPRPARAQQWPQRREDPVHAHGAGGSREAQGTSAEGCADQALHAVAHRRPLGRRSAEGAQAGVRGG